MYPDNKIISQTATLNTDCFSGPSTILTFALLSYQISVEFHSQSKSTEPLPLKCDTSLFGVSYIRYYSKILPILHSDCFKVANTVDSRTISQMINVRNNCHTQLLYVLRRAL